MQVTLTIADAARDRGCSRQTIYNNIERFDLDQRGRIVWNQRFWTWSPDKKKGRRKE